MTHDIWRLLGGFNLVENLEIKREEDEYLRQELQEELDRDKRSEEDNENDEEY
jgi:hypothetical protein